MGTVFRMHTEKLSACAHCGCEIWDVWVSENKLRFTAYASCTVCGDLHFSSGDNFEARSAYDEMVRCVESGMPSYLEGAVRFRPNVLRCF